MKSLVVLSHPEPTSFAAALAKTAADVLDATLVDLYREGFDPRLSAADFSERANADRLEPMAGRPTRFGRRASRPTSPVMSTSCAARTCS